MIKDDMVNKYDMMINENSQVEVKDKVKAHHV
jgi:hypothetical protein